MPRKYPVLTRAEYAARRAAGERYRDASLYEPDHAPRGTVFVLVNLGPGLRVFKRKVS